MDIEKLACQQPEKKMNINTDDHRATQHDLDADSNEKVLPFPVKYRGMLKSINGRDEEHIMRNEWD